MKVSELRRNPIRPDDATKYMYGYSKSKFTAELPIVIGDLEVWYKILPNKHILIGVFDKNKKVANLVIEPSTWKGLKLYHVGTVALHPNYQGQNIGYELYRGLIALLNINLTTVGSHSPGAQKLWMRLSQDNKISAWGIDIEDQSVFKVKPHPQKPELTSARTGKHVYDYGDTGLILTKRGGKIDQELESRSRKRKTDATSSDPLKTRRPDLFGVKQYTPLDEPETYP